ncbi:ubiquitin thioesterase otulin isoform 1-T1 [Anomaloglossus baeobatrachus]|uniref:ubiquitin thioesterase otulin isoform X1 n=1 Tax=Anomaloglossus baeobatrachus TaxID=238106 RepID=UPI003F5060EC
MSCDAFQLGQPLEDVNYESAQEADVPVTVEVAGPPESSQQLEPEILDCAAELPIYTRHLLLSEPSDEIDNGENPSNFLDIKEIRTNNNQGMMALDPVDQKTKRSSGEWTNAGDGKADGGSLSECSKRSRLFQDPQPEVTDGGETLRDRSSVPERKQPEDVPELLCTLESSREMGDCIKNRPEKPPSDPSEEETPEAVGLLHKEEVVTDGICSSTANKTSKVRKTKGPEGMVQKESSLDVDEDIYRDEEEIEQEKIRKGIAAFEKGTTDDLKLGVGPEVDILEYCQREWRGKTSVAKIMKEGYEQVSHCFNSIRRVRGDNYCALRATLFQCLSQMTALPQWMADDDLTQLPETLIKKYEWIKLWKFWHSYGSTKTWVRMKESLELLKKKWSDLSEIQISDKKQAACDEIFQNEEEYCLYEAVKFLMLKTAIDLFNASEDGREVPVFSWLLFARNTSNNPCEFMKNHLNHVGHTGGLEQVEMFLLGYTLRHTIKVYRLYKYGTDEFITHYPNDQADWPVVTLITEDDRHYNVPVRVCEETSV